jgi:hypothetical protein
MHLEWMLFTLSAATSWISWYGFTRVTGDVSTRKQNYCPGRHDTSLNSIVKDCVSRLAAKVTHNLI